MKEEIEFFCILHGKDQKTHLNYRTAITSSHDMKEHSVVKDEGISSGYINDAYEKWLCLVNAFTFVALEPI